MPWAERDTIRCIETFDLHFFLRRSTGEASQKKKLERAETNSVGGAASVGLKRLPPKIIPDVEKKVRI